MRLDKWEVVHNKYKDKDVVTINVLILEDDEIQRYFLCEVLKNLEKKICLYEAETKDEAVIIANNVDVDIFIIDIELREGNGIDFSREIRKIDKYQFTYMIFVSGYEEFEFKAFKEIKCYEFIRKPYRKALLESVLKNILVGLKSGKIPRTSLKKKVILKEKNIYEIDPEDICYIEAFNKGVKICFVNDKNMIERYISKKHSFREIRDNIDNNIIIQSHRSYMININRIFKVYKKKNSWIIKFKNIEDMAYISNKYKDSILQKIEIPFG